MDVKKYLTPENIVWGLIFVVFSAFMVYYPSNIKTSIISGYKKGLEKAAAENKLRDPKKRDTAELLSHVEKGDLFALQEHDTTDFMHTDYFGEPWRMWANTFIIWEKARIYFFFFLFLLIMKPYINRIADYINIFNLRSKGIKLEDYRS